MSSLYKFSLNQGKWLYCQNSYMNVTMNVIGSK